MLPFTVQDTERGAQPAQSSFFQTPTPQPAAGGDSQRSQHQGHPREYDGSRSEILGNTVDNTVRLSSTTVPNRSSLTDAEGLPFGFIASPFAEASDSSRWLRRAPERCQECGAFRNLYIVVELKTGRWACNFCGTINTSEDIKSREAIESCRELRDAVVEYVEPSVSSYGAPAESIACVHMFVVDSTIRPKDLEDAKKSLAKAIQSLPPNDLIGLITFDGVVRVFDLGRQDLGLAQVLIGVESPTPESLNALGQSGSILVAPVHACAGTFGAIVNAIQPPVRGRKKARARCVGAAIEIAVAVAASVQPRPNPPPADKGLAPLAGRARVTVLLGGEPTVGPGSVVSSDPTARDEEDKQAAEYWTLVGERSRRLGVTVDVMVSSLVGVGVRRLQMLTSRCGGEVVGHSSFGDAMARDISCGPGRFVGSGGVVDVHACKGVTLLHIIGPLVAPATREEVEIAEDLPNLALSPAVEARHGFTVLYQLEEDTSEAHIYFQIIAAWNNRSNERILRVSTVRVATTGNTATMLQSVDAQVVGVLIAKEAVLRVRNGEPLEAVRSWINVRLQNIAKTWSDQVQATFQGRFNTVPSQLAGLPAILFHLQHGPVLGSILNDADDSELVRLLFLNASLQDSIRLLHPTLLSVAMQSASSQLEFNPVGLESLSLLPDRVLLLDHHTHIFIWSGKQVAGAENNHLRAAARNASLTWASSRFPAPEVYEMEEDGSMARWLMCRLNPSHRDGGRGGGVLSSVASAVRGIFHTKFVHTDDESMAEWLLKLHVTVS